MKYKLVKTYPGSPELGTEVEKESNSKSSSSYFYRSGDRRICVLNDHVEHQTKYWEKVVDNVWWCVWKEDYLQEGVELFKAWTPYKIECIPAVWENERFYFKTKEEAERYVIKNKPCLTLTEVSLIMGGLDKKRDVFLELQRIVKSRL